MKHLTLLITMLLLLPYQPSFGAFPVKKTSFANYSITKTTPVAAIRHNPIKATGLFEKIKSRLRPNDLNINLPEKGKDTYGILSLISGLLGIVGSIGIPLAILSEIPGFWEFMLAGDILLGILFAAPAVILGAIGMHHHEKFSFTGLTLGIIEISFAAAFFLAIIFLNL